MRLRRHLKQVDLADKARTGQSAISRIENQDYDGWTFKTLLTIALALDARLTIKLEPIEHVIERFRNHESEDKDTRLSEDIANTSAGTFIARGSETPDAQNQVFEKNAGYSAHAYAGIQ
jgi:hypothetical protein